MLIKCPCCNHEFIISEGEVELGIALSDIYSEEISSLLQEKAQMYGKDLLFGVADKQRQGGDVDGNSQVV